MHTKFWGSFRCSSEPWGFLRISFWLLTCNVHTGTIQKHGPQSEWRWIRNCDPSQTAHSIPFNNRSRNWSFLELTKTYQNRWALHFHWPIMRCLHRLGFRKCLSSQTLSVAILTVLISYSKAILTSRYPLIEVIRCFSTSEHLAAFQYDRHFSSS